MIAGKVYKSVLTGISLLAMCGCGVGLSVGVSNSGTAKGCSSKMLERIYCGMNSPSGRVSDEEWRRFLADEVTPRFPQGFTVISGHGQWRNTSGTIEQEDSKIIEILHESSHDMLKSIEQIVKAYKSRFSQEAVLLVSDHVTTCLE